MRENKKIEQNIYVNSSVYYNMIEDTYVWFRTVEKIATRNMFYDETGKHVRPPKEILDEAGQLPRGCKIISKGEVYERNIFTVRDSQFKSERFLDEVKRSYTDLINIYVSDDKEKLKVFEKNGVYLPMKRLVRTI